MVNLSISLALLHSLENLFFFVFFFFVLFLLIKPKKLFIDDLEQSTWIFPTLTYLIDAIWLFECNSPGGILNDGTGSGKSWISLCIADNILQKSKATKIYICPKSIKSKWKEEITAYFHNGESKKKRYHR
jgi:hypothetical protein